MVLQALGAQETEFRWEVHGKVQISHTHRPDWPPGGEFHMHEKFRESARKQLQQSRKEC